ncbi:hypothetical protein Trydic_g19546 [Trypoxylus dichotomus]
MSVTTALRRKKEIRNGEIKDHAARFTCELAQMSGHIPTLKSLAKFAPDHAENNGKTAAAVAKDSREVTQTRRFKETPGVALASGTLLVASFSRRATRTMKEGCTAMSWRSYSPLIRSSTQTRFIRPGQDGCFDEELYVNSITYEFALAVMRII